MRSEALENIITMLRAQATERGDAEMTIDEWREAYDGLGGLLPAAEGVPVESVDAAGVPAEWIGAGDGPVVVYVHGGGYCIGSLDSHRPMLTHLASAIGGRVLAVDYRLAPEHPFPAALDDACTAYRWVLAGGVEPSRVVVAGDSAGGGLTLATVVALRDAGDPLPAAGVCLSPWADLTQSGSTMAEKADADPMVHAEDLDRWAAAYAGADGDPAASGLSPVFADLSGLPPLLVEVGTAEVLLDDARRVAERARAAGVDVTLFEGEDLIHVWHFFAGAVPEADEGITRVAEFVRRHAGG
ncbi:alpha/beta hydrolase [Actinomarinicola tropica]|uniref:Alpha/beta hydrolase fold domain-containing protein n=1 Tax=Actinomarinicola tropica TaxID=2789776 RepID=A0A5Q2RLE1_9ACTN|nr:alpha/beta hydrolase [Actinomarinicola tropica]QGG94005.1 alpha/beta hydrolase fold domain-containing protein [Actinomarinicola tropica]